MGAHQLIASELSVGKNAKLRGKAYLDMVKEEFDSEADEGSKEDMATDVKEGEI